MMPNNRQTNRLLGYPPQRLQERAADRSVVLSTRLKLPLDTIKRILALVGLSTLAIVLASACAGARKDTGSASSAQFDQQPVAVVIYAYVHYPGVPMPKKTPNDRYCAYLPSLVIWGDGLAFLDENIKNASDSVLSGTLDALALNKVFEILDADNFFTSWQAPGPNPSGTSLKIGAKLNNRPVIEYESGSLGPQVYVQIIEMVKPALQPLSELGSVDQRIEAVLKGNENCNTYMYSR
jgi:hypothetical protein